MRYLSVCSGIEAATVAWHHLGWEPVAFSEIDPFPRAVLRHHYPNIPLHGDFTTIQGDEYGPIDLICGGTPCQSFSVAGLRGGLADGRGNLTLEFLRLVERVRPRWVVWENVPGAYSANSHVAPDPCPPDIDLDAGDGPADGEEVMVDDCYDADEDHAFACFLAGLQELGYGIAYRTLDAQHFGVPQRRRRIFVVGYLGDWRRAAAVLFERHCLQGHPAPRREAGQNAPTIPSRSSAGGGLGTDFDCDGGLIASTGNVAHCLNAGGMGRQDYETETLITHSLRGEGFDASEDGTGRGTPLVPVCFDTTQITSGANYSNPKPGDPCHPLAAAAHPPLRSMGHKDSHANAGGHAAVAFDMLGRNGGAQFEGPHDTANLRAASGGSSRSYIASSAVRRLTPEECEALQGFPRSYTQIPWRGRSAAECPDGPRYKVLGNSWAVPCARWIGERINLVEKLFPDA